MARLKIFKNLARKLHSYKREHLLNILLQKTTINGEQKELEYQQYYGNLGLYDAEVAFDWIRRNIRAFGGDPENITIGGGSSGAGMTSVLTSLASVGPYIKGFIQISGDGFAPTTGFVPPPSWVRIQKSPPTDLTRISGGQWIIQSGENW